MTDDREPANGDAPSPEPPAVPRQGPPKRRFWSTGASIGSVLVGFDQQVFRASKPPAELVQQAQPVRGVSGEDGSYLTIELPPVDEDPEPDPSADRTVIG